jgi:dipeptidyl aminopeptidase/acylaminoacyl peptidase
VEWSESLHDRLQEAGQMSELYMYQGEHHNISVNFGAAMQRLMAFFDQHVKGGAGD